MEKGKTMAKYIDRDMAEQALIKEAALILRKMPYITIADSADRMIKIVQEVPAADVAPVVHGRWVFGKDLACCWGQILKNKYHLYCSECLEQAFNRSEDNDPDFDIDTPYCPNCGSLMDKEATNELD